MPCNALIQLREKREKKTQRMQNKFKHFCLKLEKMHHISLD